MSEQRKLIMVLGVESLAVLLVVIAAFFGYVRITHLENITICQQQYVGQLSGVLAQRAQYGNDTRNANLTYDRAVVVTQPGSPARTRAYATYQAAITLVNIELAAHPIPGPSDCLPR